MSEIEKKIIDPRSNYSEEIGQEIAFRLAEGQSLRKICSDPNMPALRTVLKWASDITHPIVHHYAWGRMMQAETMADEIVEIADQSTNKDNAAANRVRVDARKWVAAKLKPEKYGEKISAFLDHIRNGNQEQSIQYSAMTKEQALELLRQRKPLQIGVIDEIKEGDVQGGEGTARIQSGQSEE